MRAVTRKQAALIGLGALLLFGPAMADPSDDMAGPAAGTKAGGGSTDKDSDFDNVEIADPVLAAKIGLMRIGSQRGANNLLGVFAGLKNKTTHKLDIEIETIYKDAGGNELNTSSWIHFTLDPRAEQDYRSSAISEAAVDFLIRIRHPHAEQ